MTRIYEIFGADLSEYLLYMSQKEKLEPSPGVKLQASCRCLRPHSRLHRNVFPPSERNLGEELSAPLPRAAELCFDIASFERDETLGGAM